MKTGGTSIVFQLKKQFPGERTYPGPRLGGSTLTTKSSLAHLLNCGRDALASIDCFMPHLPTCAVGAIGFDGLTFTVVRHPVERAISHLQQLVRVLELHLGTQIDPRDVYLIPSIREGLLSNHQLRVFSLDVEEGPNWDALMDAQNTIEHWYGKKPRQELHDIALLPMDEKRLDAAKRALTALDLVGVTHDTPRLLDRLADRTGIRLDPHRRVNVGGRLDLDADLVERITEDNHLEMDLFGHACALAGSEPYAVPGVPSRTAESPFNR